MNGTKLIAWGTSKLLEMHLDRSASNQFEYCVDDFSDAGTFMGLPVKPSSALTQERTGAFQVVVFAVSNKSLQAIFQKLNSFGLSYRQDFCLYSDFFYQVFVARAREALGFDLSPNLYKHAVSATMNSRAGIQTTILGTWTLIELLKQLNWVEGSIAEVGAFECGNALLCLNFLTHLNLKRYFIFDSFEGFPCVGEHDPRSVKRGDLSISITFREVLDSVKMFPEATVVKGNVPDTFSTVPLSEKFSLVFYDCDLYQPALDTYAFFWDRIVPGGYLVIHDHEVQSGGFTGVKKATDEFFCSIGTKRSVFYENTMCVIQKP